jgi:hypothetical protein
VTARAHSQCTLRQRHGVTQVYDRVGFFAAHTSTYLTTGCALSQIGEDVPKPAGKKRKSHTAQGLVITRSDWINFLKDNERAAARDAVRKENGVIKRATSELTKKVAASQKVEKSAAGKLNMLNKQLLLLESAESAWEQGPNKCNSSQLQALVVSRQGFMQRGNKAAVVRASPQRLDLLK